MPDRFETFIHNIMELNRCIQRLKEEEMGRLGLRPGHAMCLYYLGKSADGLTVSQLTAMSHEDKAAVSRCLSSLSRQELVARAAHGDGNSYRVPYRLTASGQQVVDRISARAALLLQKGGARLTNSERDSLYRSMQTIIDNLCACGAEDENKNEVPL